MPYSLSEVSEKVDGLDRRVSALEQGSPRSFVSRSEDQSETDARDQVYRERIDRVGMSRGTAPANREAERQAIREFALRHRIYDVEEAERRYREIHGGTSRQRVAMARREAATAQAAADERRQAILAFGKRRGISTFEEAERRYDLAQGHNAEASSPEKVAMAREAEREAERAQLREYALKRGIYDLDLAAESFRAERRRRTAS